MVKHTIDHYISNLLYYNECVVVPGFGAFLTRYFPAEINAATHMFRPPSKRVAFNARIQENDGLLAQHIAKTEGVSFEKAMESIEISVRSWKKVLRSGKKVNLTGIGRLYMSDIGKLQFNPAHDINYDIHSYGLNIFRANAMDREQEIKRSVNKAIEKHQTKKSPSNPSKEAKPTVVRSINMRPWIGVLGPVAALVLVGAYLYINPGTANTVKEQVSGIFRLDSTFTESPSVFDAIASSESSIGFSDAERLNGEYGPEDDVLSESSEEETADPIDESSIETEINSQDDSIEESTSEEAVLINEVDSESVEAFQHINESPADNAVSESTKPVVNKKEESTGPSIQEMLKDNFYLPEKPLYNVKKRPEGESAANEEIEAQNYQPYRSAASNDLVDYGNTNTPSEPAEESKPAVTKSSTPKLNTSNKTTPKTNNDKVIATAVADGSYQIVVGAFSDVNNANNYVAKLKSEGWIAYTYRSGNLNRVAIGSLGNEQQADKLLSQVKQLVNPNAWVNKL